MSLDLAGIHNVGEFYSHHYLTALLEHDLAATLSRWTKAEDEGGAKAPPKLLAALATRFFAAQAKAAGQADPAVRLEAARGFHPYLLEALGYERRPGVEEIGDGEVVPVVATYEQNRRPYLWIVEAPFGHEADEGDPLDESPSAEQVPAGLGGTGTVKLATQSWRELLDGSLLRHEDAPRWVLVLGGADVFLVDRDKWPAGKLLHFDLGELMSRRQAPAMRAMAGLLHREVLLPEGGQSLLDVLDENSHKHAFAVSTDLKYGARQAIELIANEAIHYLRTTSHGKVFGDDQLAKELTRESLFYLYRLLFLFYVEARSAEMVDEGGNTVVPMKSDAYLQGYSLESLRELEQVPLVSVEAREGFFLDTSLRKLFELVFRGHGYGQREFEYGGAATEFTISGLRSPLFDEDRTPILKSVKLRNVVVQRVIELLSLSREGKRRQRGRISYATLGINQLGAVYEGLLSYTGFFAQTELYEIRAANEMKDPEARTYFVPPEKIGDYTDDEKVRDERGVPIKHAKGAYLFRLAGRDREKSASYYTPEVLTRCLTKYTLKERLGEVGTESYVPADEILKLVVCEPAMGSGAFLNEAVNQLADAYLERKQAEVGRRIPAERMGIERQRVKYLIATNNCYGVDLNPLAAELGKVSLWLNVLQPGVHAPYFDRRIAVGNSLIGARREVFDGADLRKAGGKKGENWLTRVPVRVGFGEVRPAGSVYHFLVPDLGMVPFDGDKVIAGLEPENVKLIKKWRKEICKPFSQEEVERLVRISDRVDELWGEHVAQRVRVLSEIRQAYPVWPATEEGGGGEPVRVPGVEECEEKAKELDREFAPGVRLKAVMDYWAALWFWPISEAGGLPERGEWISDVENSLDGLPGAGRTAVVSRIQHNLHFHHWDLFAPEVVARGGFDVALGNPPWQRVTWDEAGYFSDFVPRVALDEISASEVASRRAMFLSSGVPVGAYAAAAATSACVKAYLSSTQNYPDLVGSANLYKAMLARAWYHARADGAIGMIHDTGVLEDARGVALRRALLIRARYIFQFKNERRLFPEVEAHKTFALSVSRGKGCLDPRLVMISHLYHPSTVDESLIHDGRGPVPLVKTVDQQWDLRGHAARCILVGVDELKLMADALGLSGDAADAPPLMLMYATSLLDVLRTFCHPEKRIRDTSSADIVLGFDETTEQQKGGVAKGTWRPSSAEDLILSGSHIYVGTPFNKTPRDRCSSSADFDVVDISTLGLACLPGSNFRFATDGARARLQRGQSTRFRIALRRRMVTTNERSLISAIISPGVTYTNSIISASFDDLGFLVSFAGQTHSIVFDFFFRATGRTDIYESTFSMLPAFSTGELQDSLAVRVLRLNCLTEHYSALWEALFCKSFCTESFTKGDPRLSQDRWTQLGREWNAQTPFRTHFERRQAMIEVDAIVAVVCGLSWDQLRLIYTTAFRVLARYDASTWFDSAGEIAFTPNKKGLPGVGLEDESSICARDWVPGDVIHGKGKTFVAPFDVPNREQDMLEAYEHFSRMVGSRVAGSVEGLS
jgi:hypothetical protein